MSLKPKDTPELSHFEWEDPFLLENQLNEDERMIRDAVRAYAQEKLQPRAIDAFANETTDLHEDPVRGFCLKNGLTLIPIKEDQPPKRL